MSVSVSIDDTDGMFRYRAAFDWFTSFLRTKGGGGAGTYLLYSFKSTTMTIFIRHRIRIYDLEEFPS